MSRVRTWCSPNQNGRGTTYGSWTLPTAFKSSSAGISYVTLVVDAVKILAVPTSGETSIDHDTGRTRFRRKVLSLAGPSHGILKAGVGELSVPFGLRCRTIARVSY